jgi:hypothetical protein
MEEWVAVKAEEGAASNRDVDPHSRTATLFGGGSAPASHCGAPFAGPASTAVYDESWAATSARAPWDGSSHQSATAPAYSDAGLDVTSASEDLFSGYYEDATRNPAAAGASLFNEPFDSATTQLPNPGVATATVRTIGDAAMMQPRALPPKYTGGPLPRVPGMQRAPGPAHGPARASSTAAMTGAALMAGQALLRNDPAGIGAGVSSSAAPPTRNSMASATGSGAWPPPLAASAPSMLAPTAQAKATPHAAASRTQPPVAPPDASTSAAIQCPFCTSEGSGKTRQRRMLKRERQRPKFGRWWRQAGYSGPKYCQRCSEVFRDHIMRQKPNSAQCSRENPCDDCAKVLQHFDIKSGQALWDAFDKRAATNKAKVVEKRKNSGAGSGNPAQPLAQKARPTAVAVAT